MKAKSKNNNKVKEKVPSFVPLVFKDFRTGLSRPLNEQALDEMLHKMRQVVVQDESILKMDDILIRWGIIRREFYRIRQNYKDAEDTYEYCQMIIGARRERGGLTNQLNAGFVERSMSIYDPEYKKLLDDKLKSVGAQNNQGFVVHMAPFESSDLVPPKKGESNE